MTRLGGSGLTASSSDMAPVGLARVWSSLRVSLALLGVLCARG